MSAVCFVACTPGLEGVLAAELRALGVGRVTGVPGGAEVEGADGAYVAINRWSRIASRVLLRIATVGRPDELARVSLAPFVGAGAPGRDGRLRVDGPRGFVEAAARAWGPLVGSGERAEPPAFEVSIRPVGAGATVSLDTTGELLHFRGYRQEVGRAPMRETLAAGVLALAGWSGTEPLWDVMCGSGTLLVEAAELAAGLAPGRNRAFAFERFAQRPAAVEVAPPAPRTPVIVGSDLNAGALGTARRNARRAGVLERLTLERLDATKLAPRPGLPPGLVIANLPYGKRVGEKTELARLYRGLGSSLRRACAGWRFAFLLEEGAEHLGLAVSSRARVANGGLRCELVAGRL